MTAIPSCLQYPWAEHAQVVLTPDDARKLAPVAGRALVIAATGGGVFGARVDAAPGTYVSDGGTTPGRIIAYADGSSAWVREEQILTNPAWFGLENSISSMEAIEPQDGTTFLLTGEFGGFYQAFTGAEPGTYTTDTSSPPRVVAWTGEEGLEGSAAWVRVTREEYLPIDLGSITDLAPTSRLQLRRGTTVQHDTFTGAAGELTVDTTLQALRLHDGSTLGGHFVGAQAVSSAAVAATLKPVVGRKLILDGSIWDAAFGTYTSDGGTVGGVLYPGTVVAYNGSSAWIRRYDEARSASWYASPQHALDAVVASGKSGRVHFEPKTYALSSGLTLDVYYVSLSGEPLFDASGLTSGAALTIVSSLGDEPYNSYSRKAQISGNVRIKGPGKSSSVIGVDFNSPLATSSARPLIENLAVFSFGIGHRHANRSYLLTAVACEISDCDVAIDIPSGYTDYGERITYISSTIYNNELAVRASHESGALHFVACSFDYNDLQFDNNSRIFLTDCHVENTGYASPPIVNGPNNGASFIMKGGWLTCSVSNTVPIVNCTTDGFSGGGASFSDVFMSNLGSSRYFAIGDGLVSVERTRSYNTRQNPPLLSAASNILIDGSFETHRYDAFIVEDTAAIVDRWEGADITLNQSGTEFHPGYGSKSLVAEKIGGAGDAATFVIAGRLHGRNSLAGRRIFYKKPGSETGVMYISPSYAAIADVDGIPTIVHQWVLGSATITFTSAPTDWVEFIDIPTYVAPNWATHAVMVINLNGVIGGGELAPACVYFDDAEITEM